MSHDLKELLDREMLTDTICPICGKNFVPAALHLYKINGVRVCTWTCQLRGERQNYKYRKAACHGRKKILAFDTEGNFIEEFASSKEASEVLGIAPYNIQKCCRGEQATAGQLIFRYKKEEKEK